jgi:hypothetical protein
MTVTGVSFDQSYVPVDQPVTVTASVGVFAPGTGTPTGTIQFSDEFGPLGGPVALEPDGTAQIQLLEDVGDHVIYAWYSGDDARYTVSSGQGDLSVYDPNQVPDPPVTPPTARALTTTKLVSSSNPVAPGESFVVAATVAPSAASNAVPSGTIQFSVGTTAVGGPISLDPSQSASTTLTAPTTATRQAIRATYSGDANFRGSTGFLTQVTRAPTVTPTPPVVVAVPDKTPATFTLAPAGKRLATALRRGLRVHVACSENCSAVLRLLLRSHGKSVVVARGSKTSAGTKAFDVVISFSPRYRRQLAKARRVTLRLSAAVKDAAANQSARAQNLTLKR